MRSLIVVGPAPRPRSRQARTSRTRVPDTTVMAGNDQLCVMWEPGTRPAPARTGAGRAPHSYAFPATRPVSSPPAEDGRAAVTGPAAPPGRPQTSLPVQLGVGLAHVVTASPTSTPRSRRAARRAGRERRPAAGDALLAAGSRHRGKGSGALS